MTEAQFQEQFGKHLNPQQWEAVRTVDGAVLLLAVPGSGKTTVLVTRLGYMVCVRNIRPENILTMTYTVAATREMGARFSRLFGSAYGSAMEIRTINGLSQKIIDYYSQTEGRTAFTLQEDEGVLSGLVREIYREYYADYPTESVIRDIRTAITYCKNSLFTPSEIQEYDIGLKYFPDIYARYCETLRRNRQMDYDDQLVYALNILKTRPGILADYQNRFQYLCVDESQDTSRLQHEMIQLLAKKHGNLFLVGDEDQSIYGFRAAFPEALMQFAQDWPGSHTLIMEQNFRSTPEIIDAANHFVSRNRFRHPKQIQPTVPSGLPVEVIPTLNRAGQFWYLFGAAQKGREAFTVLARNNDSMVPLIDLFERSGIVYNCRQFDEVFFSHRILRDILDIIQFSTDDRNPELFLRIYHKLGCMISRTAAQYACAESARTGKPLLLELLRCPELSQYSMSSLTEIYEGMQALPGDSAADALVRIRGQIGYGKYVEQNKLDTGKFLILDFLAKPLASAAAFAERLEELRVLIRDHVNTPGAGVTLSTIHSSKGLEYESVYLLDVLDGILPLKTSENARSAEEIRQYEEDRRLCYVAMTRAKGRLHLFSCTDQPSEFLREILETLPVEQFEEKEFLCILNGNFCGQRYRHSRKGPGRILAQGEEGMLIQYSSGEVELLTLTQLLAARQRNLGTAKQEEAPAKPEPIFNGDLTEGARVVHSAFGSGTVLAQTLETITVCFDEDGRERQFLKSAVLPNGKLRPQ